MSADEALSYNQDMNCEESDADLVSPSLILILSGKRKCGKDFLADVLQNLFPDTCAVLRLSGPLKKQYAMENSLDYDQLLDASQYKEKYRYDMIRWGEEKRQKDPGYFCRHAILQSQERHRPVWVVADARRTTDLEYFTNKFPGKIKTVRISATLEARTERGWTFVSGVDDAESECGLDCVAIWDFNIENNQSEEKLVQSIQPILRHIEEVLHT